jgi:Xaa-Pro aminopeptidase
VLTPLLRAHCATRRARLLAALPAPALIPAGLPVPRNYPANPYPYRASSHFLYLVGLALPGAALWLDGDETRLLVPPVEADADLWHGPSPGPEALRELTGLHTAPLTALASLRRGRFVACPPCVHLETAHALGALLERAPHELGRDERDVPLLEALIALRLQHDEGALAELRRAADVSVRAHLEGMARTQPGGTEQALVAAMEAECAREGFTTAYPSIVTTHGEVLHNHDHGHVLAAGDLVLCDLGAETDTGYAADITRTWPVSGKFSATQRALYELVLAMQQAAIAQVRPGVRYRDVHLAAARVLTDGLVQLGILRGQVDALVEDGVHALFFPHGIGHLLGLDVHDMEDLGDRAGYAPGRTRSAQFGLSYLRLDRDLVPGMLVTIEPGFYQVPSLLHAPERVGIDARALDRRKLAAFADVRGIRIEDDVLVTATGHEVLTRALPKAPDAVEARVGTQGT